MNDETAIRATGLSKRFGHVVAVDGLDLTVRRREVYGFLGPNGSGKSTTIRMLCGLLNPTSGDIDVLGCKIPRDAEALKRRIGYMTQKFSLYEDLTVDENLAVLAAIHDMPRAKAPPRIDELVERFWLKGQRKQLAGTLSGGQKQRLALAGTVLHKPDLLFLDEPTSAVDPQSRREFWDSLFDLADQGTTLLVSTHYMDEAERCTRLAILDFGRIVADGTPQELLAGLPGRTWLVTPSEPRRAAGRRRRCADRHVAARARQRERRSQGAHRGEPPRGKCRGHGAADRAESRGRVSRSHGQATGARA